MIQYIPHPYRDECLEFDVPDEAVFLAVGGRCPTCRNGDRRITEIDFVTQYYRCGNRPMMPLDRHDGLPRIRWDVTIPKSGPAYAHVYETGSDMPTVVHPRVIDGALWAGMKHP